MPKGSSPPEHLTDDQLLAYLERTTDEVGRGRADAHLAGCERCRAELLAVTRVRRATRQRRWVTLVLPAAAAAVFVLFFLSPSVPDAGRSTALRSAAAGSAFRVIAPADGDTVGPGPITFVWNAAEENARYRFTLTNTAGDDVVTADGVDTTYTLRDTVILEAGQPYFWYVDVLFADGRSVAADARELIVRR